jgi:predicted permease
MLTPTFSFFCIRKQNIEASQIDALIFFYIYWHIWFSLYLIKYIHRFFLLKKHGENDCI